jgi:hypothetical protein
MTVTRFLISLELHIPLFGDRHAQGQPSCFAFTLKVSLKAGQSYQQQLGGGLTLKVRAEDFPNPKYGWYFTVEDRSCKDYIAPVNLPL